MGASEASVLILGENGVGKELVARALHRASPRAAGPLLAVDMGSLPEALVESELFGHRRGSFTDARESRPGRFVAAAGGTLCSTRSATRRWPNKLLLAALERREVMPLAATSRCPSMCACWLPPTCPRPSCSMPSASGPTCSTASTPWCLRAGCASAGWRRGAAAAALPRALRGKPREIEPEALARLTAHRWPGNVRELRQARERATLLANKPVLT